MVQTHLEANFSGNFPHTSGSLDKAELLHAPKKHGSRVCAPTPNPLDLYGNGSLYYNLYSCQCKCSLYPLCFQKVLKVSNESQIPEHFCRLGSCLPLHGAM